MAGEISEKTRIILNWGGAVAIVTVVFFSGRIVEAWQQQQTHALETNQKQDTRIDKLDDRFSALQLQLADLQRNQEATSKAATDASRNTTAILWALGNLKVALAERGIHFKDRDDE